jgi:hypothetical protein
MAWLPISRNLDTTINSTTRLNSKRVLLTLPASSFPRPGHEHRDVFSSAAAPHHKYASTPTQSHSTSDLQAPVSNLLSLRTTQFSIPGSAQRSALRSSLSCKHRATDKNSTSPEARNRTLMMTTGSDAGDTKGMKEVGRKEGAVVLYRWYNQFPS